MEETKETNEEIKQPEYVCQIIITEQFDGSVYVESIKENVIREATPEDIIGMCAKADARTRASITATFTLFAGKSEGEKNKILKPHRPWRR